MHIAEMRFSAKCLRILLRKPLSDQNVTFTDLGCHFWKVPRQFNELFLNERHFRKFFHRVNLIMRLRENFIKISFASFLFLRATRHVNENFLFFL
jgi:hypothetical protein